MTDGFALPMRDKRWQQAACRNCAHYVLRPEEAPRSRKCVHCKASIHFGDGAEGIILKNFIRRNEI